MCECEWLGYAGACKSEKNTVQGFYLVSFFCLSPTPAVSMLSYSLDLLVMRGGGRRLMQWLTRYLLYHVRHKIIGGTKQSVRYIGRSQSWNFPSCWLETVNIEIYMKNWVYCRSPRRSRTIAYHCSEMVSFWKAPDCSTLLFWIMQIHTC